MAYKNLFFFAAFILLFSCNDKQTNRVEKESANNNSDLINCYKYINKSDTVILKTIEVGKSITGTLEYYFKGKDRMQGTIQGFMRNELLIADYTCFLKDMPVRQVVFKQDGETFIEGIGDTINTVERTFFKNTDSLSFLNSNVLSKIECK